MRVLFYLEQPAFTKSRTPAGGGSPYTEGTLRFAFYRGCPGSPERCSPQERFPHKHPVTCGHRPALPDACGRDFRCAVAPLKCGRNLQFPHKRPVTCGHRPASPDACGRDFRFAIAPLKCGRNLRFPHKRPLPLYTHADRQRTASRQGQAFR